MGCGGGDLRRIRRHDCRPRAAIHLFARGFRAALQFLYGWTLFLIIQTGAMAAVAVALGKFLGVLVQWVSTQNLLINLGRFALFHHTFSLTLSSQQLVAVVALLVEHP